jgi:hypothetical protein
MLRLKTNSNPVAINFLDNKSTSCPCLNNKEMEVQRWCKSPQKHIRRSTTFFGPLDPATQGCKSQPTIWIKLINGSTTWSRGQGNVASEKKLRWRTKYNRIKNHHTTKMQQTNPDLVPINLLGKRSKTKDLLITRSDHASM